MSDELSPEYEEAIREHSRAAQRFAAIGSAYRSGDIDTDAYIDGREAFDKATQEFDLAFEREQTRLELLEDEDDEPEEDTQGDLF